MITNRNGETPNGEEIVRVMTKWSIRYGVGKLKEADQILKPSGANLKGLRQQKTRVRKFFGHPQAYIECSDG